MPSRVAAVAKIVVCVTTSSGSRPVTTLPSRPVVVTQPQTRQLHVPTQTTLLITPKPALAAASVSLSLPLYQAFHLSHRHQRADLTKMDATLARIFVSNAQWVEAVNSAEPGFFEKTAKGQSPKVRVIPTSFSSSTTCGDGGVARGDTLLFPFALYFILNILTDPLARMLGLSRPRKRRNCLASGRYLRSPQHCEPSPSRRR
jgi:hypothetical protein